MFMCFVYFRFAFDFLSLVVLSCVTEYELMQSRGVLLSQKTGPGANCMINCFFVTS